MKPTLYCFCISFVLMVQLSCTHKNALVNTIDPGAKGKIVLPQPGTYICNGHSFYTSYGWGTDNVFSLLVILPFNDSSVMIGGGVMRYSYTDSIYKREVFVGEHSNNQQLDYYFENKTISFYSWNYDGSTTLVTDSTYRSDTSVPRYMGYILGTKNLSGTFADSSMGSHDTVARHDTTKSITFTAINDTTFQFSGQILDFGDNVLHYKYIDKINGVIVWETFHTDYKYSSLTYNYSSGQICFEQWHRVPFVYQHVALW